MPITFGSVGDILAICLLVKDCVDALSESRGAAASYQAVIRELYVLEKALLEIDLLARTYGATDELSALFESAKATVKGCQTSLQAFKSKTRRFEPHLDPGTNRSTTQRVFKGSAMKLLWQVSMKDEVARFRAEVVAYSLSINQLLATASIRTENANHEKIDARIQESQSQTNSAFESQNRTLNEIRHRLKDVDRRISAEESTITKFLQTRFEWLNQMGNDLKALMQKIITINLATYSSVLEIKRQLPAVNQLQVAVPSEPMFYLEDALGRVFPITLQFITCWDALHAVLEINFRGMQGMKKVLKKEYALQDRATRKDIDLSQKWERVFLPGRWVNMSMIFNELAGAEHDTTSTDTCPGCQAQSNQPPGLEIICSICKLVYTRLVDLNAENAKDKAPSPTTAHVHAPDAPDSFVQSAPQSQRPIVHPVPPSLSTKRKRDPEEDEGPSNFKRVRMIAKKRRLNKDAPGSEIDANKRKWEDEMDIDDDSPTTKRLRSEDSPATSVAQSSDQQEEPAMKDDAAPRTRPENRGTGSPEPAKNSDWDRNPSDFTFNNLTNKDNPRAFLSHEYSAPPTEHSSPTYDCIPICLDDESEPRDGRRRRQSPARPEPSKSRPASPRPWLAKKPPQATEEDRKQAGIPYGYSLKHWDPTEEPIILLGSVFDANSLGKWIYDWTVFHYGPATPLAEMAGELWLLLIQLAGKVKRAEEIMPKIRKQENREMVEDFLESGERLWVRFAKVLKVCEDYMWEAGKREAGGKKPVSMGKNSGCEFVDSIFGRDHELEKTEKLMTGIRLWSMRFDANCEGILRYPSME